MPASYVGSYVIVIHISKNSSQSQSQNPNAPHQQLWLQSPCTIPTQNIPLCTPKDIYIYTHRMGFGQMQHIIGFWCTYMYIHHFLMPFNVSGWSWYFSECIEFGFLIRFY